MSPHWYDLNILYELPNDVSLDDWLTVHHSVTLVDLQLDAQTSCLFTYNTLIKILYMFRAYPAHTHTHTHTHTRDKWLADVVKLNLFSLA